MEYDYNRILLENRHITNKSALVWMNILAGVVGILWVLGLLHIISSFTWAFYCLAPVSMLFLLFPAVFSRVMHLSDITKIGRTEINRLTKVILVCLLSAVFLMSVCLFHYVVLAWLFPTMIACQYYSRRITKCTFFCGLTGMIISYFLSLFIGVWDFNMMSAPTLHVVRTITLPIASRAILYLVPIVILYCAFLPLFYAITKRAELLMKKQKLAIMASQARQTFDNLHGLSDTFETDCKIKMRYLAKNGIDVDTALKNMGGNIDKYNDFALTFVGESHRKEDELFLLLDRDTLIQYGAKVHALRVKTNALGITNLTDTAFFHEMEAYAGNLEIVRANWEKLSFEWDEACDVFTSYIQSLGLKDHCIDKYGHQITYKRWGEQLQEAFDALETCDTTRARKILNDLLQYQIDADITKNLEKIVANIDEILKA